MIRWVGRMRGVKYMWVRRSSWSRPLALRYWNRV
jgi:hypothetical protein